MKKIFLGVAVLVVISLMWMAFVRQPLNPVPEICGTLSEEVPLDFTISKINEDGIELAMANKVSGKEMFIHFNMVNTWKTGRTGLVVQGMNGSSTFKGGRSPQDYLKDEKRISKQEKDFSDFMKDHGGKSVSTYKFKQQLVEEGSGEMYMRMSYDGVSMEMLQILEIPRPITVPAHVSRLFVPEGIVQFQKGTVTFDQNINGFYIPVVIR